MLSIWGCFHPPVPNLASQLHAELPRPATKTKQATRSRTVTSNASRSKKQQASHSVAPICRGRSAIGSAFYMTRGAPCAPAPLLLYCRLRTCVIKIFRKDTCLSQLALARIQCSSFAQSHFVDRLGSRVLRLEQKQSMSGRRRHHACFKAHPFLNKATGNKKKRMIEDDLLL